VRTVPQPKPVSPLSHNRALLEVRYLTPQSSIPFRQTRSLLIPDRPGVYLIHDLRGVLYAGKTRDLRRRFYEHYWLTDNELLRLALRQRFGAVHFSWWLVEGDADRAGLEAGLVAWLRPPCNRVIPRTH
jgi:excinuclease UvrABC nuclease subunit